MIDIQIEKTFPSKGVPPVQLSFQCKIPLKEISAFFGESGVGKSSLFKMLAGLLLPDRGKIIVSDEVWFDSEKQINLPIAKRSLSVMFPDHSLFPNMNVMDNLQFSIPNGKVDETLFLELVTIAEIHSILQKSITELSSGQKQRVAIVRSILQKPSLLLLDEPFSSLDGRLREKLLFFVRDLQKKWGMTVLFISHEIPELIQIAKQVFVLENGQVNRFGNPIQIFSTNGKGEIKGEVIAIDLVDKGNSIWIPNQLVHLPFSIKQPKGKKTQINQNQVGEIVKGQFKLDQ
ncbi:ABC transporter, ATP-binding protein [Leptospira yanagawae serovar Saopaulo str. Sao Paulo = ATCC 700523]|uniref:ABC transporter, ATP-binding protein n=1 Tax=Leptospira yanagawae serovar Saopaulo str. Sao Paulo = ATCC 700523 TaxID=1249483 RepID=A0A5E8H777_9LEPT|nr:ABC transporter, ATP-binding protein [Leptospira yanagawae serovar Saopaulo str. Sao Paulo = ATCC 700523]